MTDPHSTPGQSPSTDAALPSPASNSPHHVDQAFTRASPYGTHAEPTYSGALSFLRRKYSKDLSEADVAVVGIPFDLATTNRPGTRLGPRAIRAASASLAWCAPYAWDFDPCERLRVIDWGDVYFDPGRPEQAPAAIRAALHGIVSAGVAPLSLGGDHFVSYPIL
jgi:agmatinase